MKTRLPQYRIVYKENLAKLIGSKNALGCCGPEPEPSQECLGGHIVPAKTIFIEKHLDKFFRVRVIAHERVHALWYESKKNFVLDDQIEMESLFHVPRQYLFQSEVALIRFLSNGFSWNVSNSSSLKKIRKRIDFLLGLC